MAKVIVDAVEVASLSFVQPGEFLEFGASVRCCITRYLAVGTCFIEYRSATSNAHTFELPYEAVMANNLY